MRRIALIAAFLAASWSPLFHCLPPASAAALESSCHAEAPEPSRAPAADCAIRACCQAVLLPAAVAAPSSELSIPVFAASPALNLLPPGFASETVPASPSGPPGVGLVGSRLGRAPPAA